MKYKILFIACIVIIIFGVLEIFNEKNFLAGLTNFFVGVPLSVVYWDKMKKE